MKLHVFHLGSAITTHRVKDMPVRGRNTNMAVDGWMVAIFNSWGGIWVGFEVVSSENRHTFDVCVIIHISCVQ